MNKTERFYFDALLTKAVHTNTLVSETIPETLELMEEEAIKIVAEIHAMCPELPPPPPPPPPESLASLMQRIANLPDEPPLRVTYPVDRDTIMRHAKYFDRLSGDECWEWQGGKNHFGYGQIRYKSKERYSQDSIGAHRLAWVINSHKSIPPKMVIMHTCDNRACVNPSHLKLGTQYDNIHDSIAKGRHGKGSVMVKGEDNINSKLTASQVTTMRDMHAKQGLSYRQLAKIYKVTAGNVCAVIKRRTWKHLP